MAAKNSRLNNAGNWIGAGVTTTLGTSLFVGGQLGMFFEQNGKKYQLVLLDSGSTAGIAGAAAVWIDQDDFTVTTDISDVTGGPNFPAGLLLGTIAAGEYCWIQVRGPYATAATDGGDDITQGDVLYVDPTTDGTVDSTALATAPIYIPIGVATAADVDTLDQVALILIPPLNGA